MSRRSTLSLLLVLMAAPPSQAGKIDKKWIEEEVAPLLAKDDEKAFKELKNDDERERFAEVFWAKRDPTPLTPANEFKDEYYRRLAFVQSSQFPRARGGLKSEMVRVFLLLGQPSKQDREEGSLVWTYDPQQQLGISHPLHFTFEDEGSGYELVADESDGAPMLPRISAALILHPGIKDVPTYPHMMDKAMATMIDDLATPGHERAEIPCDVSFQFLKGQSGATYVNVIAALKGGDVASGSKLVAFGRTTEGSAVQQFNEPMGIAGSGSDVAAYTGIALMPGICELALGITDPASHKVTLRQMKIDVPRFDPDRLDMCVPMVSDHVEAAAPAAGGQQVDPYAFGRYRLSPKLATSYTKDSSVFVFYNVYNCGLDAAGETDLTAEYVFNKDGQYFNRIPPEPTKQRVGNSAAIVLGTEVPLATFPPGKYTVTVKLQDKTNGNQISKDAAFEVVK